MKKLIQYLFFGNFLLTTSLNTFGQPLSIYHDSDITTSMSMNIDYNQKIPPIKSLNFKQIDKSMVNIVENVYTSKYELTNLLYLTFEEDLKNTNQQELLKTAIADTTVWRKEKEYNEPLVRYYHRHVYFEDYPVVGVSYEGANLFCKWLTDKYNSNPKRKYQKVLFRLPTEKEWEIAARGGNKYVSYAWGNALKPEKKYMCNFRKVGDECICYDTINKKYFVDLRYYFGSFTSVGESLNDASMVTMSVKSFYPNNIGLYNVCGNVAEMVLERGITRGGSWESPGCDVRIQSRSFFSVPTRNIGFRIFMEVIEN